jgi:radical SAM superfamily enzyme YgiQ (UPF0313 family)
MNGIVTSIRKNSDSIIIVGGVGFSTMPELVLKSCNADIGIWGDGEFTLVQLLRRLESNDEWYDLPNIVYFHNNKIHRNKHLFYDLKNLPQMKRNWFDNLRYFKEGGQVGFETKRGCPSMCIYCADPLAKGKSLRIRPPISVADELESLLEQGIDHLHTCDSEFNIPEWHAADICKEIIRRNLGDKLRWYAYCTPSHFSIELAQLMRKAGCAGINFGVDHGDKFMLRKLKRDFKPSDILRAAEYCKQEGIVVMFDLLIGSPGETRESIINNIEFMKKSTADMIGIAVGVRVYPGTKLEHKIIHKKHSKGLITGDSISDPKFFIEPAVAPFVSELVYQIIGDDKQFLFFDPSKPKQNYNYNANNLLVDAIRDGYRGAYWDILRRVKDDYSGKNRDSKGNI